MAEKIFYDPARLESRLEGFIVYPFRNISEIVGNNYDPVLEVVADGFGHVDPHLPESSRLLYAFPWNNNGELVCDYFVTYDHDNWGEENAELMAKNVGPASQGHPISNLNKNGFGCMREAIILGKEMERYFQSKSPQEFLEMDARVSQSVFGGTFFDKYHMGNVDDWASK